MKTQKIDCEIIELYKKGQSVPKIAARLGLGYTRLYRILKNNGIKRRTGKEYCSRSSGKEKEIISMYESGASAADTGKAFGVCEATVLYVLRKYCVPVRRMGVHDVTKGVLWKGGVSKDKEYQKSVKNAYKSKRKERDPLYKMTQTLRSRVLTAFKRKKLQKSAPTQDILGADWEIVFSYIESQFKQGMTWKNHGYGLDKWHIDHKVPLATAKDINHLISLMHYTNLQPLWQKENQSKGGRYAVS